MNEISKSLNNQQVRWVRGVAVVAGVLLLAAMAPIIRAAAHQASRPAAIMANGATVRQAQAKGPKSRTGTDISQ